MCDFESPQCLPAAICEAMRRPRLHTVPVKSPVQQGVLTVHRLREAYKCERTAVINTIRGLCAEFGVVFPLGPDELRRRLTDALEDASNEMTALARKALQRAHLHWLEIELQLAWCDEQIAIHARSDEQAITRLRRPRPTSATNGVLLSGYASGPAQLTKARKAVCRKAVCSVHGAATKRSMATGRSRHRSARMTKTTVDLMGSPCSQVRRRRDHYATASRRC